MSPYWWIEKKRNWDKLVNFALANWCNIYYYHYDNNKALIDNKKKIVSETNEFPLENVYEKIFQVIYYIDAQITNKNSSIVGDHLFC